jgi:hypothetical protein
MFAGRRDTLLPSTVVPKFTPAAIPIAFAQRAHAPHPANPASDEQSRMMWRWRWLIGLATAVSMVVLMAVLRPVPAPVIQLARLDAAGASRGSDARELAALQQTWTKAVVASFSTAESARAWETKWPQEGRQAVVKIIYNRAAGELRVEGRWKGKQFAKAFLVEQDFAAAVNQAKQFVEEQTGR